MRDFLATFIAIGVFVLVGASLGVGICSLLRFVEPAFSPLLLTLSAMIGGLFMAGYSGFLLFRREDSRAWVALVWMLLIGASIVCANLLLKA